MTAPEKQFRPFWRAGWLAWLGLFLLLELPAAFAPKDQDTLSENTWQVLNSWTRRIVFFIFWLVTGTHLAFHTSVTPVIVLGVPVGYYFAVTSYQQYKARRDGMSEKLKNGFRWDKWITALVYATGAAVVAGGGLNYIKGGLDAAEISAIIGMALFGAGSYLKEHPPLVDESVDEQK